MTKDDVSSGDEESKDEIKSKANLKPTTQADKAKPNEVSAFDQLDDQAAIERREKQRKALAERKK